MFTYILSDTTLTVLTNNGPVTINQEHRQWAKIIQAIKDKAYDTVTQLISTRQRVTDYIDGKFVIQNDTISYDGYVLHNSLTERIIRMMEDGFDVQPMINFITNLMQNPSSRSIEAVYTFLEGNNLPITEDGCFVAYKRIRDDWKDCHSGTIDNSIGATPSKPRNQVDDDPQRTCSHGLHVCSLEYLKHFHGSRLIAVKVNPKDVVAVPYDYHNTKMRVCEYTVLTELDMATIGVVDTNWQAVYQAEEDDE